MFPRQVPYQAHKQHAADDFPCCRLPWCPRRRLGQQRQLGRSVRNAPKHYIITRRHILLKRSTLLQFRTFVNCDSRKKGLQRCFFSRALKVRLHTLHAPPLEPARSCSKKAVPVDTLRVSKTPLFSHALLRFSKPLSGSQKHYRASTACQSHNRPALWRARAL